MTNPLLPIRIRVHGSVLVVRTIADAITVIRALPFAEHAGSLIDVMEAANETAREHVAWRAFETLASSMRLVVSRIPCVGMASASSDEDQHCANGSNILDFIHRPEGVSRIGAPVRGRA